MKAAWKAVAGPELVAALGEINYFRKGRTMKSKPGVEEKVFKVPP